MFRCQGDDRPGSSKPDSAASLEDGTPGDELDVVEDEPITGEQQRVDRDHPEPEVDDRVHDLVVGRGAVPAMDRVERAVAAVAAGGRDRGREDEVPDFHGPKG